jgi:hypothetical protein
MSIPPVGATPPPVPPVPQLDTGELLQRISDAEIGQVKKLLQAEAQLEVGGQQMDQIQQVGGSLDVYA